MKQVYYVIFIITSLILMVPIYWILSHNILNNSNARSRNNKYDISIVQVYLYKDQPEDGSGWASRHI
jgi:hypothetical protein